MIFGQDCEFFVRISNLASIWFQSLEKGQTIIKDYLASGLVVPYYQDRFRMFQMPVGREPSVKDCGRTTRARLRHWILVTGSPKIKKHTHTPKKTKAPRACPMKKKGIAWGRDGILTP